MRDDEEGFLLTRRTALVAGSVGVGGLMAGGVGGMAIDTTDADAASLATGTTPVQLRLEWGADPATQMTVSWSAPGTVPMPAPMLAYSTSPITAENPGALVFLPAPEPLDPTKPRTGPCVTSFTDGQTAQTTYHYHVPLTGLAPDTTYYYEVSDGAGSTAPAPSAALASFRTAPTGRGSFRFTAFGDQGVNQPSPFTTAGIASPGDGNGAPLFHLMVGDLAYADGSNPPSVWNSWANMVAGTTQNFPWMPVMGNHEVEPGRTDISGTPQTSGTSGSFYNGPYGSGNFFSRFLLPDNGLTNWDGNSLQGNFYSFQVGTVLFISLAGNDVNWQTSDYSHTKPSQYTGNLTADPLNMAMVPDDSKGTPNLQTQWLEDQLQAARADGSGIEMIVVQMHFPFASVDTGNSCDMGVRTAWGPLFDKYEVDLTLTGHNHNYCRSLPTRGYDPPAGKTQGAVSNPFGTYASGATINTRRPTVTQAAPITLADNQLAFNTSLGTVHLVVGGGGASSTIGETTNPADGLAQAYPFADFTSNAQAVEDAPWLGTYDKTNAYGYAVFDVDPGDGPGQTSITFQWYSVPSNGSPMPTMPIESFVFTRMSGQIGAGNPAIDGTVAVGRTVTADPGTWSPASVSLSYQWLASGTPISGATSDTYTIEPADLGRELQVQVTASLAEYTPATATSAATMVAGGLLAPAAVTVSGSPVVGGTLTAAAAPWTPVASLSYQWLRDGTAINGATGTSYSPVSGDAGHVVQVQVTGVEPGYQSATVTSVPETIAPGTGSGQTTGMPKVSGSARVGDTVKADLASGTQTDGLSYQWLLDGSEVKGATSSSYTLVPADAGKQLQVRLRSQGLSVISKSVAVQAAKFTTASRPGFRGPAAVGSTLTAINGRWAPNPEFAYQWLLDGKALKGQTERTLVVEPAYAGGKISLRATAKRTGYTAREATSDAVMVHRGSLKPPAPRILGTARVGESLNVQPGESVPGTAFRYRWLVGGRDVPGRTVAGRAVSDRATGIAYRVRPEDRGRRISVEVTAHRDGYDTVAARSASTLPVRGA